MKMLRTLLMAVALCCPWAPAFAQEAGPAAAREAEELNAAAVRQLEAKDFEGASKTARRALKLSEKALGPEHELTAAALNNLARAYAETDKTEDATKLYQRALTIYERKYGPEGVQLAAPLDGLGLAEMYGRHAPAAAVPFLERALAIREKALGPEHEDVLASLDHLATAYGNMKDIRRAEPLRKRVVEIRQKSLSPDDPKLLDAVQDYACTLRSVGQHARAQVLESRAYAPLLKAALARNEPLTLEGPPLTCRALNLRFPGIPQWIARGSWGRTTARVRITVDESGEVTEAVAETGPDVFARLSRKAALASRFAPLVVEGRRVKFMGVLTYFSSGMGRDRAVSFGIQ